MLEYFKQYLHLQVNVKISKLKGNPHPNFYLETPYYSLLCNESQMRFC